MYDSEITAEEFAASISDSVNVGCAIPPEFYLDELSRLEQLLYSEQIREERLLYTVATDGEIDLGEAIVPDRERTPCVDDVFAVCVGSRPLRRRRLSEAYMLDPDEGEECYYASDRDKLSLCLSDGDEGAEVAVFYRAAPRLKRGDGAADTVALPFEFLPLAEAKLRGEAYKRAEDDVAAARWLSEYNALLAAFSDWLARSGDRSR